MKTSTTRPKPGPMPPVASWERQVLTCFRTIQKNNRFVSSSYGDDLGTAEFHALIDLDSKRTLTPSELSQRLKIAPPAVSRVLKVLEDRGFIASRQNPNDARGRETMISSKGTAWLAAKDPAANQLAQSFADNLSPSEQGQLLSFMHRIADGLGVAASPLRPGEHPYRSALRRLTRGMYLLGRSTFGVPGCNALDWHILALVNETSPPPAASELSTELHVSPTTISGALKRLDSFVRRSDPVPNEDGRRLPLSLTQKGKERLVEIESSGAALLEEAARTWTTDEKEAFLPLLTRFSVRGAHKDEAVLEPRVEVRHAHPSEYGNLRAFLILAYASTGIPTQLPSAFIDPDHKITVLMRENDVCGVCELAPVAGDFEILHLVISPDAAHLKERFLSRSRNL